MNYEIRALVFLDMVVRIAKSSLVSCKSAAMLFEETVPLSTSKSSQ